MLAKPKMWPEVFFAKFADAGHQPPSLAGSSSVNTRTIKQARQSKGTKWTRILDGLSQGVGEVVIAMNLDRLLCDI